MNKTAIKSLLAGGLCLLLAQSAFALKHSWWDAFRNARDTYMNSKTQANFNALQNTANQLMMGSARDVARNWKREVSNAIERLVDQGDTRTINALRAGSLQGLDALSVRVMRTPTRAEEDVIATPPIRRPISGPSTSIEGKREEAIMLPPTSIEGRREEEIMVPPISIEGPDDTQIEPSLIEEPVPPMPDGPLTPTRPLTPIQPTPELPQLINEPNELDRYLTQFDQQGFRDLLKNATLEDLERISEELEKVVRRVYPTGELPSEFRAGINKARTNLANLIESLEDTISPSREIIAEKMARWPEYRTKLFNIESEESDAWINELKQALNEYKKLIGPNRYKNDTFARFAVEMIKDYEEIRTSPAIRKLEEAIKRARQEGNPDIAQKAFEEFKKPSVFNVPARLRAWWTGKNPQQEIIDQYQEKISRLSRLSTGGLKDILPTPSTPPTAVTPTPSKPTGVTPVSKTEEELKKEMDEAINSADTIKMEEIWQEYVTLKGGSNKVDPQFQSYYQTNLSALRELDLR